MIPKNINREHIIKAIEEIKKIGIPVARVSKKFHLEYNGKFYPPKYTLSLANKYANGKELSPQEFNGGAETNNFFKDFGFNIVEDFSKSPIAKPLEDNTKIKVPVTHHDERCPKCKEKVKRLLEKIYGKVEQNYKFEIGTYPGDFKNTPYYDKLKEGYGVLQSHRDFKEFVKSKTLPNCDFFIPDPGFIVEFDESQHFTLPRKIALENYPEELNLGFDKEKWIKLCEEINAKDNDPPFRDEQRAWYDTLRDFLSAIKGLKPTVRLFAKDYVWCSLDPNNSSDVKKFENILKMASKSWEIEVIEEQNPSIARLIIAGEWQGNPLEAKQLLEDICKKWPKGRKVKFLITCGGFIQFDWPEWISRRDIGGNKNPNKDSLDALVKEAEKCAKSVLSGGLDKKLGEFTDYITLLETHFFDLDIGRVMILGCHDLTIFNPRSKNAKGWRKKVNDDFKRLAQKEEPIYVLHHPHTTVKSRTWFNAWVGLIKTLSSVKQYAGSGRYYESDRKQSEWDALADVLKDTKYTDTIDVIIWKKKEVI